MMKAIILLACVAASYATIAAPANNAHYTTWSEVANAGIGAWSNPSGMCIKFMAQGSNDAHILLSPVKDVERTEHAYEIVLGGWGNTKSVIRYGTQGHALDTFPLNPSYPGNVMSASEARHFWINMVDGELNVGRGKECYKDVIMTASFLSDDPERVDDIKYVAFGAWDTPVYFDAAEVGIMESTSDWLQFNVPGNGRFYSVFNRPNMWVLNSQQFEVVFKARGDAATLGFLPGIVPSAQQAIEVVIDAKNGTRTEIWKGTRASGKAVMISTHETNDLVSTQEYRTFWIRKYGKNLAIGTGPFVGQNAVVSTIIPDVDLDQFVVGWTANDYPAQYWMVKSWSGRMPENCEEDDALEDYFEEMLDAGVTTDDVKDDSGFNCKLIHEWKDEKGARKLTHEDYKGWQNLMYAMADQGNPTAIAILRRTYPKPTELAKSHAEKAAAKMAEAKADLKAVAKEVAQAKKEAAKKKEDVHETKEAIHEAHKALAEAKAEAKHYKAKAAAACAEANDEHCAKLIAKHEHHAALIEKHETALAKHEKHLEAVVKQHEAWVERLADKKAELKKHESVVERKERRFEHLNEKAERHVEAKKAAAAAAKVYKEAKKEVERKVMNQAQVAKAAAKAAAKEAKAKEVVAKAREALAEAREAKSDAAERRAEAHAAAKEAEAHAARVCAEAEAKAEAARKETEHAEKAANVLEARAKKAEAKVKELAAKAREEAEAHAEAKAEAKKAKQATAAAQAKASKHFRNFGKAK